MTWPLTKVSGFFFQHCLKTFTIWKSFRRWNKISRFVPATEQFFVRVYVGSFNNTDNLRIFFRGIAVAKEAFVNIGIQANQLDSKLRLQLG